MKRSGKFYRKNEAEVMRSLGLNPTYNSGSGWIEKEDGQNDYIICQLKSTDAQSIKVNQKDIRVLENNAFVCHKIPVFCINFLNVNENWLMIRPKDLQDVAEYITTGDIENFNLGIDLSNTEDIKPKIKSVVKSSKKAREKFNQEREQKYIKFKSAK